jgi:hypothetical protein
MSHQQINGRLAGANVASRELRQTVKAVINHLDPIGLLSRGCPTDEYAPEIERIAQRLAVTKTLSLERVQTILYETFVEFFDSALAGPKERYRDAAREIVRRLNKLCD